MGRPQTTDIKKAIDDSISEVSVLCTDAHPSYTRFAAEKSLQYYPLNSRKQRVKGLYHIQNVNAFHYRLKKWIRVFNGVASKYLDNYLAWFLFLDAKGCQTNVITRHEMLVKSCQSKVKETCRSIRESHLKLA